MAAWAPCPSSATKREITWRGSSLASAYCTHVGPEARCPRQRGFRGRAAPPRRLRTNKTAAIARHLKRAHRVSQCCKPHQIRHACVRQGLRAASFAQNIRFAAPEENLHVLIWYVFLICHAMFCHALFCHAMFSYVSVMLCSVVLCSVQFCHVRRRGGCSVLLCHVVFCRVCRGREAGYSGSIGGTWGLAAAVCRVGGGREVCP